ncbi:MAG: hypothetical protein ABL940_05535 [Bacteroidia bacterium]
MNSPPSIANPIETPSETNDTIVTNWNGINTGNVYVMELNAACMSDTASSVLTSYAAPTAIIDTVNIGTTSQI